MREDASKQAGVILLLTAIVFAILITFFILNYIQTPKKAEAAKESVQGGEITLTVKKPPIVKDDTLGSVSLTVR